MGYSQAVRQGTLTPSSLVRIQISHPAIHTTRSDVLELWCSTPEGKLEGHLAVIFPQSNRTLEVIPRRVLPAPESGMRKASASEADQGGERVANLLPYLYCRNRCIYPERSESKPKVGNDAFTTISRVWSLAISAFKKNGRTLTYPR